MIRLDMELASSRRYIGEVVLRRYMVDKLVGEGSFAWVYRARSRDGEVVAVKILHSSQPTAAVRFIREIRVLQALPTNPYVAGYIDHGHSRDGNPLMVLEFVDGITLKLGLERRPHLSLEKAVAFVAQLCQAFVGLHQLGVAHRDVKPENILMARDGSIKLIDFGLIRDAQGILKLLEKDDPLSGRVFEEDLDRGVIAGTPEYMAPEQFSDSALDDVAQTRTDTSSDVFSLGVILFELLTGHKPFPMREVPREQYPSELLRYLRWRIRLRDQDVHPLPGLDSALQSIVRKALRRNPRRRQPDARVLMDDLLRYQRTGQGVVKADDSRTQVASIVHGSIFNLATAPTLAKRLGTDPGPSMFAFEEDTDTSRGNSAALAEPAGRGHSAPFFDAGGAESMTFAPDPSAGEQAPVEAESVGWPAENLAELSREESGEFWQSADLDGLDQFTEVKDWGGESEQVFSGREALEHPVPGDFEEAVHQPFMDRELVDEPGADAHQPANPGRHVAPEAAPSTEPHGIEPDLELHGGDEDEPRWPLENLADPPREGEPVVLSAPTDAPTLAGEELFDELEDDELAQDFRFPDDEESLEEVNLADLVASPGRSRR